MKYILDYPSFADLPTCSQALIKYRLNHNFRYYNDHNRVKRLEANRLTKNDLDGINYHPKLSTTDLKTLVRCTTHTHKITFTYDQGKLTHKTPKSRTRILSRALGLHYTPHTLKNGDQVVYFTPRKKQGQFPRLEVINNV